MSEQPTKRTKDAWNRCNNHESWEVCAYRMFALARMLERSLNSIASMLGMVDEEIDEGSLLDLIEAMQAIVAGRALDAAKADAQLAALRADRDELRSICHENADALRGILERHGAQEGENLTLLLARLRAARDTALRECELLRARLLRDADSDLPVASCSCQTKTPEIQHHKPGCKYRLIIERNAARAERDGLQIELAACVGIIDELHCDSVPASARAALKGLTP